MLDEAARQRALDTYHVLDSLPEEAYDDVVRLAALLCDVPTALVSLIDRDRQWLKARHGFELRETPRGIAFCDHAIRDPEGVMEVRDASRDPRFAGNPLVTAQGGIRFYAGVPLVTPSGAAIGTVCVIDQKPRELAPRQREALASLARLTMNLLEQRHRERELQRELAFERMKAAEAVATPAPVPEAGAPAVEPADPTRLVGVLELQDHAGAVERLGDRAVERALRQLEELLGEALHAERGDVLSRSTGSPEMIVLLHGQQAPATFDGLAGPLAQFRASTGLHVLAGSALAAEPQEPLPAVFLRADAALSAAKDADRGSAGGAGSSDPA